MANKKPTAEQVRNVLSVGAFEKRRQVDETDPIEPISMRLHIDQVAPYDRNPRKSRNPEYESILESLRANGQEEALTVTRRPGDEKYMIKRGGNTRLEIMRMLYHEAGDTRFEYIDCLFKPWVSESECIVGHLIENSTQGPMTLIDKARGYRDFKREYEREHGVSLGQRKLAALLREQGAAINPTALGLYDYALDVLEPAIPRTLADGLGKAQVEKLRRMEQAFRRLAEAHGLYDAETMDAQIRAEWHDFLSQLDGEHWSMELALHEFEQRMSFLFMDHAPLNRIRYDLAACLERDPKKVELISTEAGDGDPLDPRLMDPTNTDARTPAGTAEDATAESEHSLLTQGETAASGSTPAGSMPKTPAAASSDSGANETGSTATPTPRQSANTRKAATPDLDPDAPQPTTTPESTPAPTLDPPASSFTAGQFDIKSHRARIRTLAMQFAQLHSLQRCIIPLDVGYGWFLDMPATPLPAIRDKSKDPRALEQRIVAWKMSKERGKAAKTMAWWLLWQTVGIYDYRSPTLLPGAEVFPECTMRDYLFVLYSMLPDSPQDRAPYMLSESAAFRNQVGEIQHPIDLAHAASYILPEHMLKYIELMTARTQLQAYANEQGINLWEVRS